MTLLTEETDVFEAAHDGRCAAVFLARRRPGDTSAAVPPVLAELERLRQDGWQLSVDRVLDGDDAPDTPTAYATGFTHDVDLVGMFEAPSASAALAGTRALERAGWDRLLRTTWLLGPREFQPVVGPASRGTADTWAFFALWAWNDAWQAASPAQRRAYDQECDEAFTADVAAGAAITGRHRLDAASSFDHLGVWRVPGPGMVDAAMRDHARVADFKFTTSRHYLGRRVRFEDAVRKERS